MISPKNVTPQDLPAVGIDLLQRAISSISFDPATSPREFIIELQAKFIIRLASNIISLESHN